MTSSPEMPSPEQLLKKRRPSRIGGERILEMSGDFKCLEQYPKDPPIQKKNTTVIVIHYGGSKTLRRQQNTMAESLKHLVLLGKITGNLHK